MRKLKPVTPGELLVEEFLVPMGIAHRPLDLRQRMRFIALPQIVIDLHP